MNDIQPSCLRLKVDNQNQTNPPTQQIHSMELVGIVLFA